MKTSNHSNAGVQTGAELRAKRLGETAPFLVQTATGISEADDRKGRIICRFAGQRAMVFWVGGVGLIIYCAALPVCLVHAHIRDSSESPPTSKKILSRVKRKDGLLSQCV